MAPTVVSAHHLLAPASGFSTPQEALHELPVAPATSDDIFEAEAFRKSLCQRPLPSSFDVAKISRLQVSLLSCVEGLYRDRLMPIVGEIQTRLRSSSWTFLEIQSVLPLCARNPELTIIPPAEDEALRVFLRIEPAWFNGWINEEDFMVKVPNLWKDIEHILMDDALHLKGGINNSALLIWQRFSSDLTLGEVRHIVELAIGRRSLLTYDPLNGSRLNVQSKKRGKEEPTVAEESGGNGSPKPRTTLTSVMPDARFQDVAQRKASWVADHAPSKTASLSNSRASCREPRSKASATRPLESVSAAQVLALELRARPLPESLAHNPKVLTGCQQSLCKCIESLYRDRLMPTLAEVQRRLTERSWGAEELQAVLPLSAREPETYEIVAPVDGKPLCIFLQHPPEWFEGWVDADRSEAIYSSEVWKSLEDFLREGKPILEGGINGAALALRQRALPHLQHLSLGEIRDLVKRAVAERGLLTYAGGTLRPQFSTPYMGTSSAAAASVKLEGLPASGKGCHTPNGLSGRRTPANTKSKGTAASDRTKGLITSADHLSQVLSRVLQTCAAGRILLNELTQLLQDNCGLMLSSKTLGCARLVDVFHLPSLREAFELEQSPKSGLLYLKLRRANDGHMSQPFSAGKATDGSNRVYSVI